MSKKKSNKRKKLTIAALTPEQETLLSSLLSNYKHLSVQDIVAQISSPLLAKAFVERLPLENGLSQLITGISEAFPQKEVRKSIRKLLFKLKTKGFDVPDLFKVESSSPILKPVPQEDPQALIGTYDAAGNRGVMVALPRVPRGFDVGMGIISEERGILEFFYGTYSKKGFKQVKETLLQSENMSMVDTSLAHAATALERAYKASENAPSEGVRAYAEFRSLLLEKTSLLETPPIHELITEEDIDKALVTENNLDKLFAHPLMKLFTINHEKLSDLIREISNIDDSHIYLTDAQKSERKRELQEKWLAENITLKQRQQLKYRLEEMAYLLWKKEQQELAHLALAAAKIIQEEKNIVLDYLFTRTLSFALGESEDADFIDSSAHQSS